VALAAIAPFIGAPLTDISSINSKALRAWREQWLPAMPEGKEWSDWDWAAQLGNWTKHIDRFEIAVWSGETLCGLAIGKPSQKRQALSIYALQGSPIENHPLKGKILAICIDAALAYGTALGCQELRLVKPVGGIIGRYGRLGFTLVRPYNAAPYCTRMV
jgi:hypothetical protein